MPPLRFRIRTIMIVITALAFLMWMVRILILSELTVSTGIKGSNLRIMVTRPGVVTRGPDNPLHPATMMIFRHGMMTTGPDDSLHPATILIFRHDAALITLISDSILLAVVIGAGTLAAYYRLSWRRPTRSSTPGNRTVGNTKPTASGEAENA